MIVNNNKPNNLNFQASAGIGERSAKYLTPKLEAALVKVDAFFKTVPGTEKDKIVLKIEDRGVRTHRRLFGWLQHVKSEENTSSFCTCDYLEDYVPRNSSEEPPYVFYENLDERLMAIAKALADKIKKGA